MASLSADAINSLLGNLHQRLETDKALADQVQYCVKPKVSTSNNSWLAVYGYHGPDEETRTLLHTHRQQWTADPGRFIDMIRDVPTIADPVVNAAYSCRRLEEVSAWAEMLRRCYCILLSQIQKKYRIDANTVAAQINGIEPKWQIQADYVEQLQEVGSRYEALEEDLGEGVTFVLGVTSPRQLYVRPVSLPK